VVAFLEESSREQIGSGRRATARAFHESFSLPVRAAGLGNAEFTKKMHQSHRIRVLVSPSHRVTAVVSSSRFVDAKCASLNPIIFRDRAIRRGISRNIDE